ncbi:MAG TPA: S-layer homology domain-containing protein [Flexilinea sp.]|jgi:hypothetical protein|nr:S-layer homology domain-containing protein [Flexilinea sp.]
MEKRTAKSLIIIFIFILCLGIKVPALAGSPSDAESQAEALKQLGLMKDDPELSFSFDEELDRVQATVFLIRSTGKDAEAIYGKGSHPFSDVPAWADKYIAYAYEKGLVNGESETTFGTEKADYPMVLTFLLRSLGYNDSEGDFPIKSPENLADAVGLLPDDINEDECRYGDLVAVSWAALQADLKKGNQMLAEKLISENRFTASDYQKALESANTNAAETVSVSSFETLKSVLLNPDVRSVTVDSIGTPLIITGELTIPKGVTVTINRGNDFYIENNLINNGTIEVTGADSVSPNFINYSVMAIQKGGKVTNNGKIVLQPSVLADTEDRGPVGGQLRIFDGTFENNGSVYLKAGKVNTHGGMVAVIEGPFTNNALIIVDGFQIDIAGTFTNNADGIIINNTYISTAKGGTFINNGSLLGEKIVE